MVYAAAKAAQNTLTRAAAQELGPRGIRVNSIVCGMFHTDSFHKAAPTADAQAAASKGVSLGRIADPDEVVGTAIFLASEASSYLTGELLLLDGGGS
jgi:NAD(P)-dependent dehydrogenase (short-subunit alcohol dehydrogenase family)